MDKSQERGSRLVIPGGNAAIMLHAVKEPFNLVAVFLEVIVNSPGLLGVCSGGDNHLRLVMGEKSKVVLSSLRVSANKVLQTGFTFEYNYLEEALASFYKEEKD